MITNRLIGLVRPSDTVSPMASDRLRTMHRLTILVFLLAIGIPALGSVLRKAKLPKHENRPLNPAPELPQKRWQFQCFPQVFDAYFSDRIGFRRELLQLRRKVLLDTLGDSISEIAIPGRDGWFFMNVVGPSGLPCVQQDPSVGVAEWSAALAERRAWLQARGIRYIVMVVPEKSSVYPEYHPDWMQRHPPPDLTHQLQQSVELIDPLPAIRDAKATTDHLYFKKDSHWTDAGAYRAYQELGTALARAMPGFQIKPWERFRLAPWTAEKCDLAWSLGYTVDESRETMMQYTIPHDPITIFPNDELKRLTSQHKNRLHHIDELVIESSSGHGRGILLHDSFGGNLIRMMGGDFRRLVTTGTYGFPINLIEAEKPDVVIQMFVARTPALAKAERLPLN